MSAVIRVIRPFVIIFVTNVGIILSRSRLKPINDFLLICSNDPLVKNIVCSNIDLDICAKKSATS